MTQSKLSTDAESLGIEHFSVGCKALIAICYSINVIKFNNGFVQSMKNSLKGLSQCC